MAEPHVKLLPPERFQMKREIGLGSVIAIIISLIIGSGIFVSPSVVLANTGSVGLALIMWVVPAILSFLVALCYMELASLFPASGGEYKYFKEIYGPLAGFIFAWIYVILLVPVFLAILALTVAKYLLGPFFLTCELPENGVKLIAICSLVLLAAANGIKVRYVTKLQTFFTFLKVFALVVIIGVGCYQIGKGNISNLARGFEGSHSSAGSIAVSIQVGIFIYIGWNAMFFALEEVKSPQRTIPLGIGISLFLVTSLYLLTNVAFLSVLTPEEMLRSEAVVTTFADKTFGRVAPLAPVYVALTVLGSLSAALLTGSRLIFAVARDGLCPPILATIHVQHRTPWLALAMLVGTAYIVSPNLKWKMAVITFVAVVFILLGDIGGLIEMQGFIFTLNFLVVTASVLYLKLRKPHLKAKLRVPLVIPVCALALTAGLFILGFYQKPVANIVAIVLVAWGIPVYLCIVLILPRLMKFVGLNNKVILVLQKAFRLAPTDSQPYLD